MKLVVGVWSVGTDRELWLSMVGSPDLSSMFELRLYQRHDTSGEFRPTKLGIEIPPADVPDLMAAIAKGLRGQL